jgi:biotin carboxyl carrier protein
MQNEVQAPHAGTITAVHCAKGGRVEKGELLVEYEVTE